MFYLSFSQIGRLPGLKSSHLHFEVFTGVDEDITIEDALQMDSPWEEAHQHPRSNNTA